MHKHTRAHTQTHTLKPTNPLPPTHTHTHTQTHTHTHTQAAGARTASHEVTSSGRVGRQPPPPLTEHRKSQIAGFLQELPEEHADRKCVCVRVYVSGFAHLATLCCHVRFNTHVVVIRAFALVQNLG